MATFGAYETVQELHRGRLTTVFKAQPTGGDQRPAFVVKSFDPPPGSLSHGVVASEVAAFLESGKAQQQITQGGAAHWAPIHELGATPDGAYYVTDHYIRSAQRLVLGQVRLDGYALHTIIASVVQGLLEMRVALGRPHGNITPSNVLLIEHQVGIPSQAVLTDPLADSRLKPEMGDHTDLRAIGELIYQLVLHQPFQAEKMGGWPVEDSANWSSLGKTSQGWRELCNRLLDPDLPKQCPTLDQIHQEVLPPLAQPPKRELSRMTVAGVGVGVVVLVGLVWWLIKMSSPPPPPPPPEHEWAAICHAHRNWVAPLHGKGYEENRLDHWAHEDHLKAVWEELKRHGITRMDPAEIDPSIKGDRTAYADQLPEIVKTPEGVKQVLEAYKVMTQMALRLESWPALKQIQAKAQDYQAHDPPWSAPAEYLQALANSMVLRWEKDKPDNFITAYNRVLASHAELTALFDLGNSMGPPEDELERQFIESVVAHLRSQAISEIHNADTMVQGYQARLHQLLNLEQHVKGIIQALYRTREEIKRLDHQFTDEPMIQGFSQDLGRYESKLRSALSLIQKTMDMQSVLKTLETTQDGLATLDRQVQGFWDGKPTAADPRALWRQYDHVEDIPEIRVILDRVQQLRRYADHAWVKRIQDQIEAYDDPAQELFGLPWNRRRQKQIQENYDNLVADLRHLAQQAQQRIGELEQPPPGADPRVALADRIRLVKKDIDRLIQLDYDTGQRYDQQIDALAVRLEQNLLARRWIRAFGDRVRAEAAEMEHELTAVNKGVFPLLDPRGYWQPQSLIQMIDQEIQRTPIPAELNDQFETVKANIDRLYQITWVAEDRSAIEQQIHQLRQQLDGLASRIISDQRDFLTPKWRQLAKQIEELAQFRQQRLADTGGGVFEGRLRALVLEQDRLAAQPWPAQPLARKQLNTQILDLDRRFTMLLEQMDPRPLWKTLVDRWTQEIGAGIEELRAKGDGGVVADQGRLQGLSRRVAGVHQRGWATPTHQAIVNDIQELLEQFQQLHQVVYAKLDPRHQVPWEAVIKEIAATIQRLKQEDTIAARLLNEDLEGVDREVQRLWDRAWSPDLRDAIEAEVQTLQTQLREIYVAAASKQMGLDGVASYAAIQVWNKRRLELLSGPAQVGELQQQIRSLRRLIRDRLDRLTTAVPGQTHPRSLRVEPLHQAIAAKREQVFEQTLKPWLNGVANWNDAAQASRWDQALEGYEAWRRELERMLEDFRSIEAAFDNAYGLNSTPKRYKLTVWELYQQWENKDESQKGVIQDCHAAIEPLLDRIRILDEVSRSDNLAFLQQRARDGQAALDPAITFAAWRRLGEVPHTAWPANIRQLEQEHELRQWLSTMVGDSIQEPQQRDKLSQELADQGHTRWARCLTQLGDAQDIELAIQLKDRFMVRVDQLEPVARFNLQLAALRHRLKDLPHTASAETIQAEVDRFQQQADQLPEAVLAQWGVGQWTDQLNQLLSEQQDPQEQDIDLTQTGPETSPVWDDPAWDKQAAEDGSQVTYHWTTGKGRGHTLRFIRVEATREVPKSFYLCTTEVSLGLVNDLMSSLKRWPHLKALLGDPDWQGPKAWEWRTIKNVAKLKVNKHKNRPLWMPTDTRLKSDNGNIPDYAPQAQPPTGPSEHHPMQYTTPEAAVYIARLFGCRLPTPGEWRAALDTQLGGVGIEQYVRDRRPNLRDQQWRMQQQHTQPLIAQGVRIKPPTAGSLWSQAGGESIWEYDDGVLWFDSVRPNHADAPPRFHRLIGNVAEFLFEQPEKLHGLEVDRLGADGVKAAIQAVIGPGDMRVIGGSAQSPPSVPVDQPQTLPSSPGIRSRAYSDVGMRLVFSAPRQSLKSKVQALLNRQGYLTAATALDNRPQ